MRIIRQSAFVASPWKNGGGTTREVVRDPPGNGAFRWRVSVADIGLSGPFSEFADYNRTLVLLQGGGIRLTVARGEPTCLTTVGSWLAFDGAAAADCELLSGPCVDLNLMVLKSMGPVPVRVGPLASSRTYGIRAGQTALIFAVAGSVSIRDATDEAQALNTWDLGVVSAAGLMTVTPPLTGPAPWMFLAILTETRTDDCH